MESFWGHLRSQRMIGNWDRSRGVWVPFSPQPGPVGAGKQPDSKLEEREVGVGVRARLEAGEGGIGRWASVYIPETALGHLSASLIRGWPLKLQLCISLCFQRRLFIRLLNFYMNGISVELWDAPVLKNTFRGNSSCSVLAPTSLSSPKDFWIWTVFIHSLTHSNA